MKKLLLAFTACACITASAQATESVSPAVSKVASKIAPGMGNACTMKETVTLNVTYNFKANTLAEAKKMYDEQNAKVGEFAKKQVTGKFDVQSQNYNIYGSPQNYGPDGQPQSYSYQVSGSTGYMMDDADMAFKFAEFLTSQKMQVGINSNSYRQGNCNS